MAASSSSATQDLDVFIEIAKSKSVPDNALVPLLRQNGWSERRIYRALSEYYGRMLGSPLPSRSGPAENARDAFTYLVAFLTLGIWATALGQIFYYLIDRKFPDAVRDNDYRAFAFSHDMAWQLAAVIVAFPVFLFMQRSIDAQIRKQQDLADSGVRKGLTYLALVVTAMICLLDAIWFIAGFLQGDLTTRLVLKSLLLVTLGGGIFVYYLSGLQSRRMER